MNRKQPPKPVFALIGPTASGKTAISIELARSFGAEIVSCDSRQIYKFMDIGTAKPDALERRGVPHHLIDVITPDLSFSYAEFADAAEKAIDEIYSGGAVPLIVGGTGFYLDGLVNGVSMVPEFDGDDVRALREKLELSDNSALVTMLSKLDPASAGRIKFNDRQRLVRAVIVSKLAGRPFSSFKDLKSPSGRYNYFIYGLTKERDLLYNSINLRVEVMFQKGLLDEAASLLRAGYTEIMPGMKTIGYQECVALLRGKTSFSDTVSLIKQHTRNYAKRQETYFRRFEVSEWYSRDDSAGTDSRIKDSLSRHIEKLLRGAVR